MTSPSKRNELLRELRIRRDLLEADGIDSTLFSTSSGLLGASAEELVKFKRHIQTSHEPIFELVGELVSVKRIPAGTAISYGYTARVNRDTTIGLVALGFSDGIPRSASNRLLVGLGDSQYRSIGRIAMDQLVIDLEGQEPALGSEVSIYGRTQTLQEVAKFSGFTEVELIGRITARVKRSFL